MDQEDLKDDFAKDDEGGFESSIGQGENNEPLNEEPPKQEPPKKEEPKVEKKATGGIANIAERLSKQEGGAVAERGEGGVRAETPMPFDLSKMSLEQMQQLKAMLAATPDGAVKKDFKPTVKLRRIDNKVVVNFGKAFLTEMRDLELNRNVERHVIPVLFLGETEYQNIPYKKFIEGEQIICEVLSQRASDNPIKEGVTTSRETGTLVEVVRKEIIQHFTVRLPQDCGVESIEIEARVANG